MNEDSLLGGDIGDRKQARPEEGKGLVGSNEHRVDDYDQRAPSGRLADLCGKLSAEIGKKS